MSPILLAGLLMSPSFTNQASEALVSGAAQQTTGPAASQRRDLVGLDAFPKLLSWLASLPSVFDRFVEQEKREQLIRELTAVAAAFASVNNECVKLAIMVEALGRDSPDIRSSFDQLIASIVELREAALALAQHLGDQAGKDGVSLAFELAEITRQRASVTNEAREQLLGGQTSEATKRLNAASELAKKAQQMVIEFVSVLEKQ